MNKNDIQAADKMLAVLKPIGGYITGAEMEELAIDEAQIYRITTSLCNEGAARRTRVGLDRTEKTLEIILKGGAQYIFDKEQEEEQRARLKDEGLQLSVKEMKRNKYYSTIALIVAVLSLVVSTTALLVSFH